MTCFRRCDDWQSIRNEVGGSSYVCWSIRSILCTRIDPVGYRGSFNSLAWTGVRRNVVNGKRVRYRI